MVTSAAASTPAATGGSPYVALGDSCASGAGPAGVKDAECDRTSGSYPSLIARFFAVVGPRHAFKDVTCSGATTRDFWNARGSKPPQIDALTPDTGLVTLTLGGNDVGFSGVLATCARLASSDRDGSPCEQYFTADGKNVLEERAATMEGRVHDVFTDIRRRSPHAKVIVVGYPALLPDDGVACAEVPFAKGDFACLRDTTKQADRALERHAVAAGAGTSFADTYTPTIGHDMCRPRDERWVESLPPRPEHHGRTPQLPRPVGHGGVGAVEDLPALPQAVAVGFSKTPGQGSIAKQTAPHPPYSRVMQETGRMEPTPRRNLREEQKILTYRRLLEAAVTVFTEKPFLEARMEDIAQAAGVTRVTVYAHFPGKAEIVDALVDRLYHLMGEAYADLAALPRWTPAGIRAWLDEAAVRWREMAPIRRVANAAAPSALRSPGEGRTQYVEAHERYVGMLVGDYGRWRGVDPAEARQRALMAVLQTESFFSAWIAVEWPLETKDPLRLLADSLCHLLGPALDNDSS